MKKIILQLMVIVILVSCSDDETVEFPLDNCEGCKLEFINHTTIDLLPPTFSTAALVPGSKIVFKFTRPVRNDSNSTNESVVIMFEIFDDWDTFDFSESHISRLFPQAGLSDNPNSEIEMVSREDINEGTFKGLKLNDEQWEITLENVESSYGVENITAIFNKR